MAHGHGWGTMRRTGMAATAVAATVAAALGLGAAGAPAQDEPKQPKIKILGPQGKLNFEIRPRDSCDTFDIQEIRIKFTGHGYKKTFRLDDPCGDWIGGSSAAPNLRFKREDGSADEAARLMIRAVGKKEVERKYRYQVRIGDTVEAKGIMRVTIRRGEDDKLERFVYLDD